LTSREGAAHILFVSASTHARALLVLGIFLLVARGLPAQASPGAVFLGMAVATSISEDKDGLTVLEGVHNAVWSETMPVTEDLQLYTRWSGAGTHTIGVTIMDQATGDTLGQTSDELDFKGDPVTYYTHDFSGTSFPADGTYAIEVTLDGQAAAHYAFYVNMDDQMPGSPALVLSVPAESGGVDENGDATISGIFEYFTFKSFPARDSFSIVTAWFSGKGTHDHSVQILGPDGMRLADSPHSTFSASYGEMGVATDTFKSVSFPAPGVYSAVLSMDGAKVFSFPLVITKQ
jgi:hypothetical protein